MDIHKYEEIVKRELEKIRNDDRIPRKDREMIQKYYGELLAKGISFGRMMKYLQTVRKLYHLLGKSFFKATKEDFIELCRLIAILTYYSMNNNFIVSKCI